MATSKRLTVADLLDNPLSDLVQEAGADALAEQSWFARRKNTITAVVQIILQVLNLMAFQLADVHWAVTVIIALIIGVGEVIIHAATKGPVTPSGVEEIRRQAQAAQVVETDGSPGFSVYHGV